jgi:gliding motility-associated-like protein
VFISKNDKGCIDTIKKDLFIEDFRPFAGNDTIIVKGESINFNASGGSTYRWTPATNLSDSEVNNPVGYYPETGYFDYNVYIKSDYGCEGNDSIKVQVVNQSAIFVPSAFSPNGDGLNETLRPIGIGYRNMNFFRVFNRWGQQVFYTTKFNEGWNGIFKGTVQDIGTYFWVLSMTNRFGKEELVKGDCILVR